MYNLLFWIAVQLILLWLIGHATKAYRNKKVYKILFAPAVILENLCRLLACCFSAKSVERVDFFQDGKPFLTDARSRIPYFGAAIYLILWQGAVYYLFHTWATQVESLDCYAVTLPYVEPGELAEGLVEIDGRSYVDGLAELLESTDFTSWKALLFVFFAIGLFPFLSIDGKQFRQGLAVLAVFTLLTVGFVFFGVGFNFLSRGWWLDWWVLPDVFSVYSLYVTLLAVTLLVHFGVRAAWEAACVRARASLAKRDKRKKARKPKRQLEAVS